MTLVAKLGEKKTISYEGERVFFYNRGFLTLDKEHQVRNYPIHLQEKSK